MTTNPFIIILVVAFCNFLTRAFPFILFSGDKEMPKTMKRLGSLLPPAVIAILIIYSVKSIDVMVLGKWLPELISIAVVVLLHLWKRSNLISIGGGTVLYMVLVQVVFL